MAKPRATLPKDLTFEAALARLQDVVAELEDPEKGLEASFELFEEGMALARFCRTKIDEIQKRVEVVMRQTPEGLRTGELDDLEGEGEGDEEDEEEDAEP